MIPKSTIKHRRQDGSVTRRCVRLFLLVLALALILGLNAPLPGA